MRDWWEGFKALIFFCILGIGLLAIPFLFVIGGIYLFILYKREEREFKKHSTDQS